MSLPPLNVEGLLEAQRHRACDLLEAAGANAPTLCDGWRTRELAIHLWQLNHDPRAWVGSLPGFGPLARRQMDLARRRMSHGEVVSLLRGGPARLRCMPDDLIGEPLHSLGEWFIHTEDVRRAGPGPYRQDDSDLAGLQQALWRRVRAVARLMLRGEPATTLRSTEGKQVAVGCGPRRLVEGDPGELLLWAYGRRPAARVTVRQGLNA